MLEINASACACAVWWGAISGVLTAVLIGIIFVIIFYVLGNTVFQVCADAHTQYAQLVPALPAWGSR